MRFLLMAIGLAVLLMVPFLIWDEYFTRLFSGSEMIDWLRAQGAFGWVAGVLLLVGDIVLPIPGTGVMAALGFVYGPFVGGIVSAFGSFCAGMLAYLLCRRFGHSLAVRLAGETDLHKAEHLFARSGGWLVALSRSLPLLPEAVACLAGIAQMPFTKFSIALACGSIPMGFVFAGIGSMGEDRPGLAIGLSLAIPPVLWMIAAYFFKQKDRNSRKSKPGGDA